MKKPPHKSRHRDHHQPKRLVALEEPRLLFAPFLLGNLLLMRPDAGFNHGEILSGNALTSLASV
jgi:hypothetical protein